MTTSTNLTGLQVIAVRYRDTQLADYDERGIDAYTASGVHDGVQVWQPGTESSIWACSMGRLQTWWLRGADAAMLC